MEKMRALIANAPCTYREAITSVLRELRTHVEVSTIEPDGLDAEIARLRPQLVVCSQPCATTENGALTWVVLYPNGDNRAEVVTLGERTTVEGIGFGDLLSLVDSTELLWLTQPEPTVVHGSFRPQTGAAPLEEDPV